MDIRNSADQGTEAGRKPRARLTHELEDIAERCSRLPVLDPRPADEILGYDETGLPH